jgi:hypothetical protein
MPDPDYDLLTYAIRGADEQFLRRLGRWSMTMAHDRPQHERPVWHGFGVALLDGADRHRDTWAAIVADLDDDDGEAGELVPNA